jgi:hypothetical protein
VSRWLQSQSSCFLLIRSPSFAYNPGKTMLAPIRTLARLCSKTCLPVRGPFITGISQPSLKDVGHI